MLHGYSQLVCKNCPLTIDYHRVTYVHTTRALCIRPGYYDNLRLATHIIFNKHIRDTNVHNNIIRPPLR